MQGVMIEKKIAITGCKISSIHNADPRFRLHDKLSSGKVLIVFANPSTAEYKYMN
jgi:hypothetical protein